MVAIFDRFLQVWQKRLVLQLFSSRILVFGPKRSTRFGDVLIVLISDYAGSVYFIFGMYIVLSILHPLVVNTY